MEPNAAVLSEPQATLPDHTQLPDKDGAIVQNFQEHPQSTMLTGSARPKLDLVYPDGQYAIGCDSGIYWKLTNPVLDGCKAPDWFLVPGVPPMLDGQVRRSYVLWQEAVRPLLVIEYVSGDGREERDVTPHKGKFWAYENAISAAYYAIFEASMSAVELYQLTGGRYLRVEPNAAGRFPVAPLGVELGIWEGAYQGLNAPWLRLWDSVTGEMLPTSEERAENERRRAEAERRNAEREKERADTAESLRDEWQRMMQEEVERAEQERKRAEQEAARAEEEARRAAALADKLRALGVDPDAA